MGPGLDRGVAIEIDEIGVGVLIYRPIHKCSIKVTSALFPKKFKNITT